MMLSMSIPPAERDRLIDERIAARWARGGETAGRWQRDFAQQYNDALRVRPTAIEHPDEMLWVIRLERAFQVWMARAKGPPVVFPPEPMDVFPSMTLRAQLMLLA